MIKINVTTATKLDKDQLKKIRDTIKDKYEDRIELNQIVDASIVGGIKINVGSLQFDSTVIGKLRMIKKQLLTAVQQ